MMAISIRTLPARRVREADVPRDDGTDGQGNQRGGHSRRRIMQMHAMAVCAMHLCTVRLCTVHPCTLHLEPFLAVEREEHQPEHVGRRQQRRQHPHHPENLVAVPEGLEEDLVLREEPGQARHTGNSE